MMWIRGGGALEFKITEVTAFIALLDMLRKIYQHETCTPELRTYIKFEIGKIIGHTPDTDALLNSEVSFLDMERK